MRWHHGWSGKPTKQGNQQRWSVRLWESGSGNKQGPCNVDGADADEGGLIGSVDDPGSASVGVYDNIQYCPCLSPHCLQGIYKMTVPAVDDGALSLCACVCACVRSHYWGASAGLWRVSDGAFLLGPWAGLLVRPWSPKPGPTCCATSSRCDGLLQIPVIPTLAIGSRVRGLVCVFW